MEDKNNNKKNFYTLMLGRLGSSSWIGLYKFIGNSFLSGVGNGAFIWVSIFQGSETVFSILFNLLGGAYSDRVNRRKLLIVTDFIGMMLIFTLILFVHDFGDLGFVLVNIGLIIINAFNYPTYKAIAVEAIGKRLIGKYNAYSKGLTQVISMVIPAIGVWLINFYNLKIALLVNGLLFGVATIFNLLVTTNDESVPIVSEKNKSVYMDIKEGINYSFSDKNLRLIVIAISLVNFFIAGFEFFLPFSNELFNTVLSNSYSIFIITQSVAALCASLVISNLEKTSLGQITKCIIPIGIGIFCLYLFKTSGVLSVLSVFLVGFFLALFNIVFFTYLQTDVPEKLQGRVISVVTTVSVCFAPLGTFTFSYLYSKLLIGILPIIGISILLIGLCGTFIEKRD